MASSLQDLLAQCAELGIASMPARSMPRHGRAIAGWVASTQSFATLERLRNDASIAMSRLIDLTAVDHLGGNRVEGARFEIVYQLHSSIQALSLRLHVPLEGPEGEGREPTVDSVRSLWPAAGWLEREVFDLFGIRFRGHPDLRRILLEPDHDGAPLRKDHPLRPERAIPAVVDR